MYSDMYGSCTCTPSQGLCRNVIIKAYWTDVRLTNYCVQIHLIIHVPYTLCDFDYNHSVMYKYIKTLQANYTCTCTRDIAIIETL